MRTQQGAAHPFRSAAARETYLAAYRRAEASWPVPFESVMVETPAGSTHVRICGAADAPPLVLLPGDTNTSLYWKDLVGRFLPRFRLYLPDQINDFGLSVRSRPITALPDFLAWLDGLFGGLGLRSSLLAGYSYGGGLALAYALARPERVSRLALIAPACRDMPTRAGSVAAAIAQNAVRTRPVLSAYLRWQLAAAVRAPATQQTVENLIDEVTLARRCFAKRTWVLPFAVNREGWQSLSVPTLFVVGEDDVLIRAERAVAMLGRIAPRVATRIVAGAGHDLLIVKPDEVCGTVSDFLRG
jgi:pimeloyl-ACP methyl ester carboxylesterase